MRLGLLALLDRVDMDGYQLKAQFEAQTGGIWPLNIGQVYSTLERLERDGLVTVARPRGAADTTGGGWEQKYHAITPAGRHELAQWFGAGLSEAPPPRDELVAKILFAGDVRVVGADVALATAGAAWLGAALSGRRHRDLSALALTMA